MPHALRARQAVFIFGLSGARIVCLLHFMICLHEASALQVAPLMSGAYAYRGGWDAVAALLRAQGVRGLFKGYWLTNSVRARPQRCSRAGCRGSEQHTSSPDRCACVGVRMAGTAWSVHVLLLVGTAQVWGAPAFATISTMPVPA